MRLLAVLCFLACFQHSLSQGANNVECGTIDGLLVITPSFCVNTTLLDCASVLVRVTLDFNNDSIVDFDSGELELVEDLTICYSFNLQDDAEPCQICGRFTDVDATGDGATFDPQIEVNGGFCDTLGLPPINLAQVQVGSDCNDYLTPEACLFAQESCGWCGSSGTCESISEDDGVSPHCFDCSSDWVLPSSNVPNNNDPFLGPEPESSRALAYGLGIGIPVFLVLLGCIYLVYRRNKNLGRGAYDFERHTNESQSEGHGTTILIPESEQSESRSTPIGVN